MRYAHPTLENKRKAVSILAANFAQGQKEERLIREQNFSLIVENN